MPNIVVPETLQGLRILILQQRGWAIRIGHPLAVRLSNQGAILGAVTVKRSTHEFIKTQTDIDYETIISADAVKEDPTVMADLASVSLADVCRELRVSTVWRMAQASRNHVNSYEDRYYYSFRQGQSDAEIVNFIKGTFLHVRRCLDEFRPDVIVLPNFAGLQHIMFSKMADARGIPLIAAVDSKVKGVAILARDYLSRRSDYLDRVADLRAGAISHNAERARKYIAQNRESLSASTISPAIAAQVYGSNAMKRQSNLDGILQHSVGFREFLRAGTRSLFESYEFYRRGGKERFVNLGTTVDYRTPHYIFRDNFSAVRYRRAAERHPYADFASVGKFIYFPLQVQPEATISVQAPLFNNQIETARQVAMAAPDDYCVVVKDHPNMTWRHPVSYIEKIGRLPNVKLVDFRIRSEEILKRASLLVSPSSSTIAEAALLRVPTIQLGDLGTTAAYPNVRQHGEFATLSQTMRSCLNEEIDESGYDAALTDCIAAAYDVGLVGGYLELRDSNKPEDVPPENVVRVTDWFMAEIRRLTKGRETKDAALDA
ncbi:MAG: hypothetical protein HKN28_04055 [Alphaproteobacteria bacterium]|nr:hypothetical protein [Alphaproteobacteria bacterium]